jgi:hypothetical protein
MSYRQVSRGPEYHLVARHRAGDTDSWCKCGIFRLSRLLSLCTLSTLASDERRIFKLDRTIVGLFVAK